MPLSTTKIFVFLQCGQIFVKNGGTKYILLVEVPSRVSTPRLAAKKNYTILQEAHFGGILKGSVMEIVYFYAIFLFYIRLFS